MPSLSDVVAFAQAHKGEPYVWGATGPHSFDCSGLVYAAYKAAGFSVPRTTAANLGKMGTAVDAGSAKPGDVVYFDEKGATDHVGIYIGNGYMIDAPHTGATVEVDPVAGYTSIRDLTSDGSGGNLSIGQGIATAAGQAAALPGKLVSGWAGDVFSIVLKVTGAAAAAALVIVGAKTTVKG